MTFSQFLHIILARRLLVISVFLTTVTAALLISLIMPKSYEANATVMVDVRPDPVTGNGAPDTGDSYDFESLIVRGLGPAGLFIPRGF